MVPTADGKKEVRYFRVDYHLLHRKLATELSLLREARFSGSTSGRGGASRFMIETLAELGDERPALWERAASCFGERRYRETRRAVGELQRQVRRMDLVDLIWTGPRTSAMVVESLGSESQSGASWPNSAARRRNAKTRACSGTLASPALHSTDVTPPWGSGLTERTVSRQQSLPCASFPRSRR